jgi:hypothetical protein
MTARSVARSAGVLLLAAAALACAAPQAGAPPPGTPAAERRAGPATPPSGSDGTLTVTSIEPAMGSFLGGTPVTVKGRNFPQGATVAIGGVDAAAQVVDAATLVGTTGIHPPGSADVVVRTPDGRTVVLAGGFRYTRQDPTESPGPGPVVTGIDPVLGPASGGTTIRVSGEHFARGAAVAINGVPATRVTVRDAATIEVVTPPGTEGPADLQVVNPGGRSGTLRSVYRYYRLRTREAAERLGRATLFVDATERAGVGFKHSRDQLMMPLGGGAAAGDFDGDGRLDLFVTNSSGPNALYRNNGNGTFTDVAEAAGVARPLRSAHGAGWADYDNDGHLDLFVAAYGESRLYRNTGPPAFRFVDVTAAAGVGDPDRTYRTTGVAWGDFDGDAYLDLLVVRHLDESDPAVLMQTPRNLAPVVRPLALYRNNRDGTFTNVTHWLGDAREYPSPVKGAGFKPAFVDYDNDGDLDIYVVNDFGMFNFSNALWRTEVSKGSGADLAIFGMGLAVADYDRDGWLDFYVSDIGASKLLRNGAGRSFQERAETAGVTRPVIPDPAFPDNRSVGWGVAFVDYDNDGWPDLYLVSGFMDAEPAQNLTNQPNALFHNRGDGTFADVSAESGVDDDGAGREAVVADFDGDGRLDLYVVNIGTRALSPGVSRLYLNRAPNTGSWLAVRPVGTRSNRDGIGARIEVEADGVRHVGVMGASQGHVSHSVLPVHFGLGPATRARVTVRWPSGAVQTFDGVPVNAALTIVEP